MANSENKRLFKNTVLLYIRTMIVMLITLYTSRVVLNVIGISDFGVYNAVGGVVGMFAIISSSLVAATQRFITYELGKENGRPSRIFSLSLTLHLLIGCVIFFIGNTFGLYLLNYGMSIPEERIEAANFVFQFSLISFVVQVSTIPYSAIIIARERMGTFAIISIIEALLKLAIVLVLQLDSHDSLIVYSLCLAIVAITVLLLNMMYCKITFYNDCKFEFIRDKKQYYELNSFIGWNFIGSTATVLSRHGINILLNIFFGVILNAGKGVATQVENAINHFISSFSTALRPQITKTYAAGDYDKCFNLVNQGTKIVLYLSLMFITPIFWKIPYILELWLKVVPDYAIIFTRLSLIVIYMDALSTPLYFLMLSTGKIKRYQLSAGFISLLAFPLTWVVYMMGGKPEFCYIVAIIVNVIRWWLQLFFLERVANFNKKEYVVKAFLPTSFTALMALVVVYFLSVLFENTLFAFALYLITSEMVNLVMAYTLGISKQERHLFLNYVKKKFRYI